MTAKIITLLAEKGGVGRTTLTINLAGALARERQRVLVVDMEGQASLSKFFFGPQAVDQFPLSRTMACVFDDQAIADPRHVIQATSWERIAAAPSSRWLADYDFPKPHATGALQFALRDFLHDVRDQFDVVLIDTPPKIQGLLAWSAVLASDAVVTPVQPEPFAVQAVVEVQRLLLDAQHAGNPALRHLGYVVTLKRRQALHTATEKMLRNTYQSQVFAHAVQCAAAYADANALRTPITEYRPKTKTAIKGAEGSAAEVIGVAAELLSRYRGEAQPALNPAPKKRKAA